MKKNTLIICIVAAVLVVGLVIGLVLVLGGDKTPSTPSTPETPNTPAEKTYTLALAVENSVGDGNKVSNYVVALLLDDAGKVVAARLDCVETTPSVVDGAIADVASILSKVEQGDGYMMNSGSFAKQTEAFENALVGKTAAELAAFDTTLVAGCTMPYSPASFKVVVVGAIANAR